MRLLLPALLLMLAALPLRAADARASATSKLLAGLPLRDSALASFAADPAWQVHAAEMDKAWQRLEREQLAQIRVWGPQFMGEAYADRGPMLYTFSGPDFLYANAFFPEASTYILCGIEPVGPVPDVETVARPALHSALANLRKSLDSVLSWSFFITKNMKVDLTQKQLSGTLPVLYVFLARAGYNIDSVELVALDREGAFTAPARGTTPGVKLVLTGASGRSQTLYYFSSNLESDAIKANPGFVKFCEQQGQTLSLVKAASYLMHTGGFARVRELLLADSKVILEDDSGIPYKFLTDGNWRLRFGGHYSGPIGAFKQYPQPELAKAFSVSTPALLPFGFGYQWHPRQSSVILAERLEEPKKPVP